MVSPNRVVVLFVLAGLVLYAMTAGVSGQAPQNTSGSDLFRTYCVTCHGTDAKGTGPLASSLTRKPADLTMLSATNGGTFPEPMVAQVIDGRNPVKGHGGGDMPVWGDAFLRSAGGGSEAAVKGRIDALVAYLKTLQK